ncbi:TadE/TadG family type IV pilus assembly protein [Arthrobacter sp. MA-N2]|uniref:TadE/TadG family type IV pilus assembly protein n=1 Tax=Arthrobacter sp. MA-N2 TaxID=1101188 RepID=UPI000688908C|nr:TadE family protein [Arthrobacter sp. MA-N2]
MSRFHARSAANRHGRERGAAAVEFALVLPLLLSMVLGVIDFGVALSQSVNLQGSARESARQGVTQGDVIASANQASGLLDTSKLQVKFVVDTSGGAPGVMVVCMRYPQSSISGFYSWVLNSNFEAKAVMKMEGTAAVTSGSQNWSGGSCTL